MVGLIEVEEVWEPIEESVRTHFVRKMPERKERDRERKRKAAQERNECI